MTEYLDPIVSTETMSIETILKAVDNQGKLLVLIRGLPGSGKSCFAKQLKKLYSGDNYASSVHAEADDFFVGKDLKYQFDAQLLPHAHKFCRETIIQSLSEGVSLAMVSNTFIELWELYDYVKLAFVHHYHIMVVDMMCTEIASDRILADRNIHNVTLETITRMRTRYQPIQRGLWTVDDISDFLIYNNDRLISPEKGANYYGIKFSYSDICKYTNVTSSFVINFPMSQLIEAKTSFLKRNRLNSKLNGDFHLTIIPPTQRQLSAEEYKDFSQLIWEIQDNIEVEGAGHVQQDDSIAFYLTVKQNSAIESLRIWLKNHDFTFDWYPHITTGFTPADIHNVPKLPIQYPNTIATSLSHQSLSVHELQVEDRYVPDDLFMSYCLLHPYIKMKSRFSSINKKMGLSYVDISVVPIHGVGDDLTYERYPELYQLVPRGLVYLSSDSTPRKDTRDFDVEVGDIDSTKTDDIINIVTPSQYSWRCILRGITKFTGTVGNDDDVELGGKLSDNLIMKLLRRATHFQRQKKYNGRSGALSVVRQIGPDEYLVCIGTKLSHVVLRYFIHTNEFIIPEELLADNESSTSNKNSPSRHQYLYLLRNIYAIQASLATADRIQLFHYLTSDTAGDVALEHCTSETSEPVLGHGTTVNMEIMDGLDQHIERIPESDLYAVCLNVVRADRGPALPTAENGWTDYEYTYAYDPNAMQTLRSFGLRVADSGPLEPISDFKKAVPEMKLGRTEGYVVKFIESSDEQEDRVVGLLKIKCFWYIICRSIREVVANKLFREFNEISATSPKSPKGSGDRGAGKERGSREWLVKKLESLRQAASKSPKSLASLSMQIAESEKAIAALDSIQSEGSKRFSKAAETVCNHISEQWVNKFDFLIPDFGLEVYRNFSPLFLSTACDFVRWYAARLDSQGTKQLNGEGENTTTNNNIIQSFRATFPILWDEFVVDGHPEDFLPFSLPDDLKS